MAERKTSKVVEVFPETVKDEETGKETPHPKAGQPTGKILFTFSDDSTETFDIANVSEGMLFRLALHGAGQKIGDSYAGAAGADDALAYAKAATKETIAQLYAKDKGGLDTWRVGGGGGGPRVNELAAAIARATGMDLDEAVATVAEMDDDDKKAYRKKPKIAAALAAIAAEKAAKRAQELADKAAKAEEEEAKVETPTA